MARTKKMAKKFVKQDPAKLVAKPATKVPAKSAAAAKSPAKPAAAAKSPAKSAAAAKSPAKPAPAAKAVPAAKAAAAAKPGPAAKPARPLARALKVIKQFMTGRTPTKSGKPASQPSRGTPRKAVHKKTLPKKKVAKASGAVAKGPKRRVRRGTVALREIRYYQRTVDTLIPRTRFCRLVKELTSQLAPPGTVERWGATAMLALHEAAEKYVVDMMEDANEAAIHAKRVTIMPKDFELVKTLRHDHTFKSDKPM